MICINCGQELKNLTDGFVICQLCGNVNHFSYSDNKQTSSSKSGSPILTYLAGIIILVILGSGVYAFQSSNTKTKVSVPIPKDTTIVKTVKIQETLPVIKPETPPQKKTSTPATVTPVKAMVTPLPTACFKVLGISSRSTLDRTDDNNTDYKVHIIYIIPSDGTDNSYDTNGRIASSVSTWNNWLCQQTSGKYLRLDTYKGALDVTFVKLDVNNNTIKTGSDLSWTVDPNSNPYVRDDLQIHLKALGFNDPHKLYDVYYDGSSNFSCGGGAFPPSLSGHVAAEYMHGGNPIAPDCSTNSLASSPSQAPGYLDYSMLHETIHTLGFVPSCAPNNTQTSHVSDNTRDLMYAGNQPWDTAKGLILDYKNNDYYNAHIANCLDLINSSFLVGGGSQLPPGW